MSDTSARRYARLHPVEAVVDAWTEPGMTRALDASTRREIGQLAPGLARSLNALAKADPVRSRADATEQATKAVEWALSRLYGRGSETIDERWRKATAIVDDLVKIGII